MRHWLQKGIYQNQSITRAFSELEWLTISAIAHSDPLVFKYLKTLSLASVRKSQYTPIVTPSLMINPPVLLDHWFQDLNSFITNPLYASGPCTAQALPGLNIIAESHTGVNIPESSYGNNNNSFSSNDEINSTAGDNHSPQQSLSTQSSDTDSTSMSYSSHEFSPMSSTHSNMEASNNSRVPSFYVDGSNFVKAIQMAEEIWPLMPEELKDDYAVFLNILYGGIAKARWV
jgi:hypothetical protein